MLTIDAATPITPQVVADYIKKHRQMTGRLKMLDSYYSGRHGILSREKTGNLSNNRVVVNHAQYICDLASGYLAGNAVTYNSSKDITALTDVLKRCDSTTQDCDLALDCSVYGRAYELVYMSSDEAPTPRLCRLDPCFAFVVYDDTVEHKEVFGVSYYPRFDENGVIKDYHISVYTKFSVMEYLANTEFTSTGNIVESPNPFREVQLNEFWNDQKCASDFESVISLIDAYNVLQSDRVNDKEQFVDALLVLTNAILGDTDGEKTGTYNALKRNKVLELPEGGSAAYLTRQFNENDVEILRTALKEDIHKISKVPDMSDENFAGNVSGVAMKFKLLPFEIRTKTKERFFREGLKRRLKLLSGIIAIKGGGRLDTDSIDITFTRSLPTNDSELATMVATLNGIVSKETLLAQLPFVEDATDEAKKVSKEKEASIMNAQSMFGSSAFEG